MAAYYHFYRCRCLKHWTSDATVNPGGAGLIVEESTKQAPAFDRKQHYQFNKGAKCQNYLKYNHTSTSRGSAAVKVDVRDRAYGIQLVYQYARKVTGAATVAVMWDNETARWYYGKCHHEEQLRNTNVPSEIAGYIAKLEVDKKDWAFGVNCAEVECIIKGYAGGRKADTLKGCYFVAYSTVDQSCSAGARPVVIGSPSSMASITSRTGSSAPPAMRRVVISAAEG